MVKDITPITDDQLVRLKRSAPTRITASCASRLGMDLEGERNANGLSCSASTDDPAHGYSILRKSHRKNVAPATTHRRSPSATTSRNGGKGRGGSNNASEALNDHARRGDSRSPSPEAPIASTSTTTRNGGPGSKKNSLVPELPASLGPPAKKRSTMNSRDAAYDDAIALSILESGSGAARAKLEKGGSSGSKKAGSSDGGGGGRVSASQSQEPEDEYEER